MEFFRKTLDPVIALAAIAVPGIELLPLPGHAVSGRAPKSRKAT